jgi:hypothetical protein
MTERMLSALNNGLNKLGVTRRHYSSICKEEVRGFRVPPNNSDVTTKKEVLK